MTKHIWVCVACNREFDLCRCDDPASVDTRPEGGDPAETGAPFTSGAVPEGQTPSPDHRSTGE